LFFIPSYIKKKNKLLKDNVRRRYGCSKRLFHFYLADISLAVILLSGAYNMVFAIKETETSGRMFY